MSWHVGKPSTPHAAQTCILVLLGIVQTQPRGEELLHEGVAQAPQINLT
jgi:hypothetical protein